MTPLINAQLAFIHLTEITTRHQATLMALGGLMAAHDEATSRRGLQQMQASCRSLQDELDLLRAALHDGPVTPDLEIKYLDSLVK